MWQIRNKFQNTLQPDYIRDINASPGNASTRAIMAKRIIDNIDIANAFNQPQSKQCFTSANQITRRIKEEKIQKLKAPRGSKENKNLKIP